MNALILGGTRFLGRHVATALLSGGHRVTLFNRGISDPGPQEGIEQIHGDRERDLQRLNGRTWDAVVDTSCFDPRAADLSARYFAERTNRYLFISTISVHDLGATEIVTEETAFATEPADSYGPLKAACEAIVRNSVGNRATIVRPGLIVGPYDMTDRFTYWPVRVTKGGEVIAPVAPTEPTQFIDVRDLAEFVVHILECDDAGAYNVTGPREAVTIGEVLAACQRESIPQAQFTWVDAAFLKQHGVQPWMDLPLWIPQDIPEHSIVQADVTRAMERGLHIRPLSQTVRDTLAWARTAGKQREKLVAGLTPEREADLLERWHDKGRGR